MRAQHLGFPLALVLSSSCSPALRGTAVVPAWQPPEATSVRPVDPPTSAFALRELRSGAGEPRPVQGSGKRSSEEKKRHVALAVGAVSQTGGQGSGDGARLGVEYEHVWPEAWGGLSPKWSIGGMLEFNTPPVDSVLIAAQLAYHPVPQARLVVAPGLNHEVDGKDSPVLRLGMAWEFELGEHTSIAPELFYDFLEEGERTAVIAVALGYGW